MNRKKQWQLTFNGLNTNNPSWNSSVFHEKSRDNSLNTTEVQPNLVSSKYKRKLSIKGGHTRNNTEISLMEKIVKSNKNHNKSKNKSKIKILNHIKKKIMNISNSKSRGQKIEKNKVTRIIPNNSTTIRLKKNRRNTEFINHTTTTSPLKFYENSGSRSREKKNRLFL